MRAAWERAERRFQAFGGHAGGEQPDAIRVQAGDIAPLFVGMSVSGEEVVAYSRFAAQVTAKLIREGGDAEELLIGTVLRAFLTGALLEDDEVNGT